MRRCSGMLLLAAPLILLQVAQAAPPAEDPLRPAAPELSRLARLRVERIELAGNTVLPAAEVRALVAPYEGRELAMDDLETLRRALTQRYVEAGYINSGVLLPDQAVVNGVVRMQAVEGRVAEVALDGDFHFRPAYLRQRLLPGRDGVLDVNLLQERMQLLLQDGSIEQVNVELAPGDAPGAAILRARVQEAPRWRLGLTVANDRPTEIGEYAARIDGTLRNLLGFNESFTAGLGIASGYDDYSVGFGVPVSARDTRLYASGARTYGNVVEAPFEALDITSRSTSVSAGISHPLWRTLAESFTTSLGLARVETETSLLGMPFSFSRGAQDGRYVVSAARWSLDWVGRGPARVQSASLRTSYGFDAFGATINPDGVPDSEFFSLLTQAQWLERAGSRGQLLARIALQAASEPLLPSEKIFLGGIDSVRGYAQNRLARDQGGLLSFEYRHAIARLPVPGLSLTPADGELALVAFIDGGIAADKGADDESLLGAGPGLRWTVGRRASLQLYKGFPLKDDPAPDEGLQGDGWHFRLALEVP